uniref:NIMA related kinase 10 n=1 Tax=Rousettus aegyptiacus TaxID=9407 RepID=A0A7J8HSP1_ROUAE|nr:NIMA related kinase 10 [Rousettus aegyptiacus]
MRFWIILEVELLAVFTRLESVVVKIF